VKLGIASLKIEGRMKSAEYVYNTAKAYRDALDGNAKSDSNLQDLAREKTGYFLSGKVTNAITEKPYAGQHIGELSQTNSEQIKFISEVKLSKGNRLRVLPESGRDSAAFKLKENFSIEETGDKYLVEIIHKNNFQKGDKVFLIGFGELSFKNKFSVDGKKISQKMPRKKKDNILQKLGSTKQNSTEQIFVRVDSIKWMMKIYLPDIDFLILRLDKKDWKEFNPKTGFIQKKLYKMIFELPKFIPENDVIYYRNLCKKMYQAGFRHFMISHISQILLLPKKQDIKISTNENVYILNDAAIQMLKEQKIFLYTYPQELEFPNLQRGKDRKGIVPVYFYPELFFSRMPIGLNDGEEFSDKTDSFHKESVNGITAVLPNRPVSFMQYKNKLDKEGFRRYLIDFSYTKPSQKIFKRVIKKLRNSEAEQPSTNFNFKLGLK
jgi:putative protease